MSRFTPDQINKLSLEYGLDIPGLAEELKNKLASQMEAKPQTKQPKTKGISTVALETIVVNAPDTIERETEDDFKPERIIMIEKGARPVARIRNNKATTEFLGVGSDSWGTVIRKCQQTLDLAIPTVGRIELSNADIPWAGTGWLIDENIIVTNAHVAEVFARVDHASSKFVFKPGLLNGFTASNVDFLEEEGNIQTFNRDVVEILWIAPPGEADVAFLRLSNEGKSHLHKPVPLATSLDNVSAIAAIGYPARDRSVDQRRVIQIFGNDVFDKKRLSPGKLIKAGPIRIHHDCSTLGGNSGSLLLDIQSGEVVGLHQGGLLDDSANLGVSAIHLKQLYIKMKNSTPPGFNTNKPKSNRMEAPDPTPATDGIQTFKLNIPIEITVKIGSFAPQVLVTAINHTAVAPAMNIEATVQNLKLANQNPNIVDIRLGYKLKDGWISDEPVIVIEAIKQIEFAPIVDGFDVDIRITGPSDPLDDMNIDLAVLERPGKAAGYVEPSGFDKPGSPFYLGRARRKMSAIFHVSPDAGFQNLKSFFGRIKKNLTATIYEWEPNHISDALELAIGKSSDRKLKMVTQRTGVAESDATISAVDDMKNRLGDQFEHVFASTRGQARLIPNSYHIKVASRDGEEFWLSSGNWKDSNQPKDPFKTSVLNQRNREWHAIIKDNQLAKLFERYIDYDFEQAEKFPTEIKEALQSDLEIFVPIDDVALERIPGVSYQDTLELTNEMLDIQPLLTPDLDAEGDRMFLKTATEMVERANDTLYIQNQSFTYTDANNVEFDAFIDAVKRKQRAIDDVRIIMRDAHDYGRPKDIENQIKIIERLKKFGFDVSQNALRLQSRCHTKGIIVDGKEVMLGSQNLTNLGSLFNRDASLLIRSPKVAGFFQAIFLYDWDNLAHNTFRSRQNGIRAASRNEATPEGFRRVKLSHWIQECYA